MNEWIELMVKNDTDVELSNQRTVNRRGCKINFKDFVVGQIA